MSAEADPVQQQRGRLFGLAYRMLGSAGEAEDAVQETYLRWYAQARPEVENPPAFLTTVLTHLCLDQLKSARRKREAYPGVWLPEPVADGEAFQPGDTGVQPDPREQLERLESVSLAFLALLETLGPLERAVYVLAEVFDHSHAEIAQILQRSPEACRQVLRRARQSLAGRQRPAASPRRHEELLVSFLVACREGKVDALARLLADDVVARADGGGYTKAANRPVSGVRAVSRLYAALSKQMPPDLAVRVAPVNGWPAALLVLHGVLLSVLQVRTSGERIERIDSVLNPEKLARVAAAFGLRVAAAPPVHGRV